MYTCKRGTKRWPLSVFYSLIDICAINATTIFIQQHPRWNEQKHNKRKLFLLQAGMELVKPQVAERSTNARGLSNQIVQSMENILQKKIKEVTTEARQPPAGKGRCHICVREAKTKKQKYNNLSKPKQFCGQCHNHLCNTHSEKIVKCVSCLEVEESD